MVNLPSWTLVSVSWLSFKEIHASRVIIYRYVLESEHLKKFFEFIQLPNFDIAADAAATFKVCYLFRICLSCYLITRMNMVVLS